MATTTKNKKTKAPDPSKMNAETEEKVEVKDLLKDERTHKIMGAFFLLIGFLLFVAFTSYLFTWQQDQSKVFKGAKILLPSHEEPVANMLGAAGAYFSDLFFRKGFGIASYLFCSFFFIIGINLFLGRKVFSLTRNIKYLIIGLPVISVAAAFIMQGNSFPWGGAAGDMISDWLQQVIGKVGTASVLLVAGLSYIIWRFNPAFTVSKKKTHQDINKNGYNDDEEIIDNNNGALLTPLGEGEKYVTVLTEIPVQDTVFNHELQIIKT